MLDVVDAIEGKKPLFECQEIRGKRAVFGDNVPRWSTLGVCAVHSVMLRAEQSMRAELAKSTLADIAGKVDLKAHNEFNGEIREWLAGRVSLRDQARKAGVEEAKAARARRH